MTDQTTAIGAHVTTGPDTQLAAENWQFARASLTARIRRRWTALVRLDPNLTDSDSIERHLESAGDDASALFRLADQVDRRLDIAFASRARHAKPSDTNPRARPVHDEFKTS